jgi:hypothetical protein
MFLLYNHLKQLKLLLERRQGSSQSFDPCLPCLIKLMTMICVHSVLEHHQQQMDFTRSSQLSSSRVQTTGQAVRSVREGGMDRQSQHKSHPARSISSSQPGGPPCCVISLAFGLIDYSTSKCQWKSKCIENVSINKEQNPGIATPNLFVPLVSLLFQ